jgi:hypothetical protein
MNRPSNKALGIAVVAAVACGAVLAAVAARPRGTAWWTDGGTIRVAGERAPVREVLWKPAEPVPGKGLGSADEYEPRLSADGTVMVFVRGRPGENADLFTSRWTPEGWTQPEPIAAVNTGDDELGPELSRDGRLLYFYSDRAGGLGGYDLWVSELEGGGWGAARNLGPSVNSRWNEYGPAVTPSGERLYFSSNRPREGEPATSGEVWKATVREQRTRQDYDLYVADMSGEGKGAEAVAALNTLADEGAPGVSPAGDFVYFASDRGGGAGGFDLYRARLLSRGGYGKVENLGDGVNSAGNDLDPALSSDGFRLTFSTDRGGDQGRYSLWTTTSREVYREVEAAGAGAPAWLRLWPWALLALLSLVPLWLLWRLLRDPAWRQRFVRLNLITQCLLLSVLAHAVIASLLGVWKIGSGVLDMVGRGGGTRVVLTSGGAVGAVAGQLFAAVTSAGAEVHVVEPMLLSFAPAALQTELARVPLPEVALPAVSGVVAVPEHQPAAGGRGVLAAPEDRMEVGAATPRTQAPTAVREESAGTPMAPAAAVASPGVTLAGTGLVETALPALRAGEGERLGPVAPEAEGGNTGGTVRMSAAPAVVSVETAVPAAAGPLSPVVEASIAGASPGGLPAVEVAPSVGTVAGGRVEVPLAARGDGGGGPAPSVPFPERAEHASGGPAGVTSVPARSDAGAGTGSVALPSVAERVAAVEAPGAPAGVVAGPLGAAAVHAGDLVRPGLVMVDPGVRQAAGGGRPALGITPEPARSERALSGARPLSAGAVPRSVGAGEIPVGIPVPLETFSQRAPETRDELVRRMGGSGETERAVGLALEWFRRHQSADGAWRSEGFDDGCGGCASPAEVRADAAMTGMVLLCFLGAGHTHQQDGPYRDVVRRGLEWLVARQSPDGDLRHGETMYGQTVGTVALCEAFAMTRDPALAEPARKAVSLVLARANRSSRADDRDTSVIGWLVFTVESARRAGFEVPRETFDAARSWLGEVAVPGTPGRYAYTRGGRASPAMTAEAMFVQQLLGRTRGEALMEQSAEFVLSAPARWGEGAPTHSWYYGTLALFQHQGGAWARWNDRIAPELVKNQRRDGAAAGSWDPTDEWSRLGGRVYQTAVCTLSLEVYYRYKAE